GATYVTEFGVRAVDAQATVAPAQDAGARDVASTSGVRTTKKVKRAARCKRVVKKVRRNGRTVRVKRIVCPKRATSSRKKS
ncbi:MAG TPA: hypothetical protein VD931_04575, partial [Baekduia sp.]|nr:hypothetical protein [Baekduia sp.]